MMPLWSVYLSFFFGLIAGLCVGAFSRADHMWKAGIIQGRLLEVQDRMAIKVGDLVRLKPEECGQGTLKGLGGKLAKVTHVQICPDGGRCYTIQVDGIAVERNGGLIVGTTTYVTDREIVKSGL